MTHKACWNNNDNVKSLIHFIFCILYISWSFELFYDFIIIGKDFIFSMVKSETYWYQGNNLHKSLFQLPIKCSHILENRIFEKNWHSKRYGWTEMHVKFLISYCRIWTISLILCTSDLYKLFSVETNGNLWCNLIWLDRYNW